MRPMRSTSRLLAVAVLVAACESPTAVDRAIDVVITTNRSVVSTAVPVDIVISVGNRSPRRVDVVVGDGCPLAFVVLDLQQREVGPPGRICALLANPPRSLEPGESFAIREAWAGHGAGEDPLDAVPLQPGDYRLVARVATRLGIASSNRLPIKVVAAP